METYRGVDTPMTKNSVRIAFTYTVIENKLEILDIPKHQRVWETVIDSPLTFFFHVHLHHLQDMFTSHPFNSSSSVKSHLKERCMSGEVPQCHDDDGFMGHYAAFQEVEVDL